MKNNHSYINTSKIDWLNKIPNHWKEVRLGSVFNERKEKVSDKDFPPLSVTKNGIVPQLENAAKSNDGDNRKLVLSGDFAINSRSDRKGSSGLSIYDGSVSLINIVLRPIDIVPIFSQYLLKSYFFKEEYYRYGRGIVEDLWTTRYSEMKNMIIPIPPKQEQTTIANFLDYKTEKINRFITKKKQLIELLNEQKAAIINQAVTKGINPNVPMKGSGIEWLGEIPEHWEVRKLKYVAKIFTGKTPKIENATTDYFENGIINWFTPGDFNNSGFLRESQRKITEKAVIENGLKLFPENSTYLISIGGTIGKVGFCSEKAFSNQQINAISFNQSIVPLFGYFYLINSKVQVDVLADFTTLPILNQAKCKQIIIAFPKDIQEQKQIVNYIENETKKIDKTISTIEKEISLVEEYKTALIAEAVTGKIDVRKWSKPLILTD